MGFSITSHLHVVSLIGSIVAAIMVIFIRVRGTNKPVRMVNIIMPPIGMSTGFLMFVVPMMRIHLIWALGAFLAGAVFFSYPLIRTSRFYNSEGQIYLHRSKAFIWILLILLIIRLALHEYVQEYVNVYQTGALVFIFAFGMLLPWRIAMYRQFHKLQNPLK
jgi:membrane protein CcdC involved in cytochrome C biogenesis